MHTRDIPTRTAIAYESTFRLVGTDEGQPPNGLVFEKLLSFVSPFLGSSRSSLYRDAVWLHENLSGSARFYYAVRESDNATVISSYWEDIDPENNSINLRVVVDRDYETDNSWSVTVTSLVFAK
jgi:hypothetical protein